MIGTAVARGKRKSTTAAGPEFKIRNGKSFKTVNKSTGADDTDGGGDAEVAAVAKRSTKGMRPGIGLPRDRVVEPFRERNKEGQSFKTVGPKNNNGDAGAAVDAWCKGKRSSYR